MASPVSPHGWEAHYCFASPPTCFESVGGTGIVLYFVGTVVGFSACEGALLLLWFFHYHLDLFGQVLFLSVVMVARVGLLVGNCSLLFVKFSCSQYLFSSSGVSHCPHGRCPHGSSVPSGSCLFMVYSVLCVCKGFAFL